MDPNQAELTTVLEHDASGRILRFVKTVVTAAAAESMKAKALLRAEEMKAAALVRDTSALVERAHSNDASTHHLEKTPVAARPVPQQRAVPRAPAVTAPAESGADDAVVPVRDAVVRARVVAAAKRRKEQEARLAAARRETEARIDALRKTRNELQAIVSAKATQVATVNGKEVGRVVMLDLLARIPPGHKASNVDNSLEAPMRSALEQLREQIPLAKWHAEFPAAFEKAFWIGVADAVAEFNKLNQPAAAPQQADAGEKQSDKPTSAFCCANQQARGQKALAAEWTSS
jgi:hypothetical protein